MRAALACCVALWASAGMAEVVPSDADVATLVGVLESRGCLIVDYNDQAILDESKLDVDVANAVIAKLVDTGEISFVDGGMQLKTPGCQGGTAAADATATTKPEASAGPDRAAFVALMEAHDCKLAFEDAEKVLTEAGFTQETANPIMEAMAAEGQLELGQNEMTIKSGNCH